jgi:DNA-binding transcriptional MerR regulator
MENFSAPNIATPRCAFTRVEAARALGISPATIDRLTKRGLLHPSRALYRPLYAVSEIERFLRETSSLEEL